MDRCPDRMCGDKPVLVAEDYGRRLRIACHCGVTSASIDTNKAGGPGNAISLAVEAWNKAAEEHRQKAEALESCHV